MKIVIVVVINKQLRKVSLRKAERIKEDDLPRGRERLRSRAELAFSDFLVMDGWMDGLSTVQIPKLITFIFTISTF
jgi:hypothetical protein